METVFISSLKPLRFVENPNAKDITYFLTLTEDPGFLQSHEMMVSQLPQLSNVSFKEFEGKNFFDHPIFDDPQLKVTWEYLPNCSLHMKMISTFEDVAFLTLFFGICYLNYRDFNVSEPYIHFASSKNEIMDLVKNYPSQQLSALLIPLQTSKKNLKDWIDNNWEQINPDIKKLPKNINNFIPKNLQIGEKIANLRNQGKTFEEISKELYGKNESDERLADYGQVKNIYHRYSEYISKGLISAIAMSSLKRIKK